MKPSELLKTERAIELIKDNFSKLLAKELDLTKISSPIAVLDGTGINDDLNGIERPVSFPVKSLNEQKAVIVHSLAKWKRLRLKELEIEEGKGILTDMRAFRPDEDLTPLHSIYVDQWDWEKHISPNDRTIDYLKNTVVKIYKALKETEKLLEQQFPEFKAALPEKITFIHSEELLARYPELSANERENELTKEYGAVFIIGIGGKLSNGKPHDGRAPDYDDWSTKNQDGFYGLNGDILVWNPILNSAFELSSMGIRVDKTAMEKQLELSNSKDRSELYFHKMLLSGQLPQSIGGGIGQSRVCMFLLKKNHIGQVQVGIWPEKEKKSLSDSGIELL